MVRKLVVKTWMFLDAATGKWASHKHSHHSDSVSAESMATSSALWPSVLSRLLPLLTGETIVAEIVIERSGPQREGHCVVIRQSPHYTHIHHTQDSKKAHQSIISNVQISVRLISTVIDEGQY